MDLQEATRNSFNKRSWEPIKSSTSENSKDFSQIKRLKTCVNIKQLVDEKRSNDLKKYSKDEKMLNENSDKQKTLTLSFNKKIKEELQSGFF